MAAPDRREAEADHCRSFARLRRPRKAGSKPSSRSHPTVRSPPITAMSISAPASGPRLGQIVAEELDVSFARVVVVLGDTSHVPNQGPTIASETIQITAVPLRKAAAQARHFLLARAAERLELPVEDLAIEDGLIRGHDNRSVSYGELIA